MDGKMEVSLDKLPVKRLEFIEEGGAERFPTDVSYDEKRLSLIRRIDFAWALEKDDNKKLKKSAKESSTPWQWQSMVENLRLAQQELSVVIDLINTVEANDAVTVASITRPKPLPNEVLSDLAVSAATKLQCFRHLGKYFKQSAKALEQQVAKEARFYGALIRLQQNWKVKRQRMAASIPGAESFTIDLFDNSITDPTTVIRPSSLSPLRVDHDSAGMLAISVPPKSCHTLCFDFIGAHSSKSSRDSSEAQIEHFEREGDDEPVDDDESVKKTHSTLRKFHRAIFDEQVFDLVNREAFNPSLGVNVTGIEENYLQLSLGQGTSVAISLVPATEDRSVETGGMHKIETAPLSLETLEKVGGLVKKKIPNRASYEIYLQQIFHEHVFVKAKDKPVSGAPRVSGQSAKDGSGLLGHFCMSLAHRIFSNRVLMELENVVCRVPYLHLMSQPSWHSRTSSWTLSMKVPESILHTGCQKDQPKHIKTQFRTKILVTDDCIKVEAEGAPNVVGLFKGTAEDISSINRYDCDLADLPVIILQQVASQVIRWLHEEALMVGIKATRDFLCLSFELEQGEMLSLLARVDPEDPYGCISWWLVVDDGFSDERKLQMDPSDNGNEYRKFLGHLSLDMLYSTLIDLVTLCNGGTNH
ncbi:hypothetical protein BT93_A1169 [Corymbia citriodora subsp. variegata]|nr:hypothetical protein BT93_A1169 [Corymbia citriodora subsp. variegata]